MTSHHLVACGFYNRTRGVAKDDAPGPLCYSACRNLTAWQRKYRELATERSVIAQAGVAADGAEASLRVG